MSVEGLDVVLIVLWALAIGWGWVSGTIRQIGMLVGVYLAAGAASIASGPLGSYLEGADPIVQNTGNDVLAWAFVFFLVFVVFAIVLFRVYPSVGLGNLGLDRIGGVVVAAIWGIMFVIAVLTILRYYAVVVWPGQLAQQQSMTVQVRQSVVAHVLANNLQPFWLVMSPGFPPGVSYSLD